MLALEFEGLRGELQAREKVFAFQIGKLPEQFVNGVAASQVFKHRFDRVTQAADDRFAVANLRIDGNA